MATTRTIQFPVDGNLLGVRGTVMTVTASADSALPAAIAEGFAAHGLGTTRADLVDLDGDQGDLAFTPPVRAAGDTTEFGAYACFTLH